MPTELIFRKGQDLRELIPLIKHAYDKGLRQIEIAFEDSELPLRICKTTTLNGDKGTKTFCLGGLFLTQ